MKKTADPQAKLPSVHNWRTTDEEEIAKTPISREDGIPAGAEPRSALPDLLEFCGEIR